MDEFRKQDQASQGFSFATDEISKVGCTYDIERTAPSSFNSSANNFSRHSLKVCMFRGSGMLIMFVATAILMSLCNVV